MEHLQYGRRKYGLLKYGRYPAKIDPEKENTYAFTQARIKAHIKDEDTNWIIQHKPLSVKGKYSLFRLKTNENKYIYSRSFTLNGYFDKVRIKAGEEIVISEMKGYKGGPS